MLDPKSATAVDRYAAEVRGLLGEDLLSVALYGSAAGEDFVPGSSDINTIIVVTTVTFSHLHRLAERLPSWRRGSFATPLVIDREFLAGAPEALAMEVFPTIAESPTQHNHGLRTRPRFFGAENYSSPWQIPQRSGPESAEVRQRQPRPRTTL